MITNLHINKYPSKYQEFEVKSISIIQNSGNFSPTIKIIICFDIAIFIKHASKHVCTNFS